MAKSSYVNVFIFSSYFLGYKIITLMAIKSSSKSILPAPSLSNDEKSSLASSALNLAPDSVTPLSNSSKFKLRSLLSSHTLKVLQKRKSFFHHSVSKLKGNEAVNTYLPKSRMPATPRLRHWALSFSKLASADVILLHVGLYYITSV